jgi:hypothetical protein
MLIGAYFTSSGAPATGLSPTVSVMDMSDGSTVVNAQAMTEVGLGAYKYTFVGYDSTKDYHVLCDGGVALGPERYATPFVSLTPQEIWEYTTRTITSGGITVAEIWDALLTSILTSGSIGKLLKDNLDAAISTRTKPADTQARVTLVDTTTTNTDMRGTDGAYTGIPPTAAENRIEMDANSTKLAAIVADSNELQTDWHDGGRLDLLLDVVAVPTGTNIVTITVNDGTNPIADVTVYIYDSTNAVFVTSGVTNVSGVVAIPLNDGSYKVRLRKTGVTFTYPESLTVSGATQKTYFGTTVSIGLPDDSDACRVYEFCYDQDGATLLVAFTATATIKTTPYDYDNKLHSVEAVNGTYVAAEGKLYWDIVKGARVKFYAPKIGVNKTVEIPTTVSTVRLADL